jgi:hypothetical protein
LRWGWGGGRNSSAGVDSDLNLTFHITYWRESSASKPKAIDLEKAIHYYKYI